MPNAKLIIVEAGKEPREFEILGEITTFGRTKDNSVFFPTDGKVSRFHAQVERKGDDFYVTDFGSSNGTTINDQIVRSEQIVKDGDKISFGGENSYVIFKNEDLTNLQSGLNEDANNFSSNPNASANANPQSETQNPKSNVPIMLTAAAVLGGLAIVIIVAVVMVTQTNVLSGGCPAPEAIILSPESGTAIVEPTEVKVQVKNIKCLDRIAYSLDGEEIASAESDPYSVTLDPDNLKEIGGETVHVLTIAVVDRNGVSKIQKDELELTFGKDKTEPNDKSTANPPVDIVPSERASQRNSQITIAETKALSEQFLKQFPGAYKLSLEFLTEVQKKTAEYKSPGFSNRAVGFRDVINQAFVAEQGLPVSLGYILAMSQSRFENKKSGINEGLWQMNPDFAANNGYNGQCGAETLSDPKQNCAAHAAAIYTKALTINLFQGDVLYGISCYGMSPAEAGQFQISLPTGDRSDFWSAIKSPKQRDALTRFFAAGIVAENPQKFNLKQDQPLSSLYKNLIVLK